MQEHKDTAVFEKAIPLSSGLVLHVTITIFEALVRGVRS